MRIDSITVGHMGTNCYLLVNEDSKEAVIIDPGFNGKSLGNMITEEGYNLKAILLTHGHFDHIMGVKELLEIIHVPVYAYREEAALLADSALNCSGLVRRDYTIVADRLINDDEVISEAGINIRLIATPGHTVGSACYYIEEEAALFSGDTLFHEGIGRTDLPTGDESLVIESVMNRLFILPDDTKVYPGHGDVTTIRYEKRNNPYVGDGD